MPPMLMISLMLLSASLGAAEPFDLRCDYRVNPLGVDMDRPGLSWQVQSNQQAYQIQAGRDGDGLNQAELWDTGWVTSSTTTQIAYQGKALEAGTRVYWRVRLRDDQGAVSPWSKPAWFEVGLKDMTQVPGLKWISCSRQRTPQYAPAELMGDWIAPTEPTQGQPVTYRTSFELPDGPVVYGGAWYGSASPSGIDVSVNGMNCKNSTRSGSRKYTDFSFYLKPGKNLISVQLDAKIKDPAFCFGMRVRLASGQEVTIQSDSTWQVALGTNDPEPVKLACAYGEQPHGRAEIYALSPLPVTWYKKNFHASKQVRSARLYCCGLGYNTPYLNGRKVGDHELDPGQTDYENIAYYQTFDVTDQLNSGENSLSILLGDGWYNQDRGFNVAGLRYGKPVVAALLQIRYADGSRDNIVTDESWRWMESATKMSNIYLGDRVDFRQDDASWQTPGFSDVWKPVTVVPPVTKQLVAQPFEPIREIRTIEPIKSWQIGKETWTFDLGENISGWVRLRFQEPKGKVLRVRCTEMCDPETNQLINAPISFWWCHGEPQAYELICDGKARTWQPQFSYFGFRYVEVSGLSKAPQPGDCLGVVVNTDVAQTATFVSSDPLLNRMFRMGVQTHFNNMHSVLEDCPHREKCMWGGDLHASWSVGFHALDSTAFYRNVVDLYYTPPFSKSGVPGNVGVGKRLANYFSDFTWAVSPLFLTYRLYELDGELDTARKHYDKMKWFLAYFEKQAPNYIPEQAAHGDHAAPTDIERFPQNKLLIAAMNFFAAARRFAILAEALDRADDGQWARDLAGNIQQSIIEQFYDPQKHSFGNGTHDSLALAFDLVDEAEQPKLATSLAGHYRKNGKKFDGGFMSYFIYPELTEWGQVDLALEMLRNADYPGLAWSIKHYNATSVWERFALDKFTRERNSHNHHAMNHPAGWMLTHLAGIQAKHGDIVLKPYIPTDLDWVEASVGTHAGILKSTWRKENGKVIWTFVIPANQRAQVIFPEGWGQSNRTLPSGRYTYTSH